MERDYESPPPISMDSGAAQTGWPYDVPDLINSPPHYKQGEIECIDAIQSMLTPEEFRGYLKGAVVKYLWRERHKGGVESLKKAEWFLKRIVSNG